MPLRLEQCQQHIRRNHGAAHLYTDRFHFDAESIETGWDSGSIESIWWLPRSTTSDFLILSNASKRPLLASLVVSDVAGSRLQQSIRLGPAQTTRLDLRTITRAAHFTGSEGGVSVSMDADAGALIASHIVFDEATGMSATMKTFERDATNQPKPLTLRAPMMALSDPDPILNFPNRTELVPQLFLRNATNAPLNTSLALNWRSNSGLSSHLPLAALRLAPGEVRILNLTDLIAKGQLPADAFWGTLVLKYQGRSGDLVPVATSFDGNGRYGLQTPFSDATAHLLKGSMWHVEVARDSLITTGNGGIEPTHAALTLFYNNGKSSYTIVKLLEPEEQIWADVGEIIRNQIPDKDGKTIPTDVTMGSYELRDLDHLDIGSLYEGKLILDKTLGHGYYGCGNCCGYSSAVLGPDPFSGMINTGGSNQVSAMDCNDNQYDFAYKAYNWGSRNTAVARLASAYTNLVGAGSTNGFATVQMENNQRRCPVQTHFPQNTVKVQLPTSTRVVEDTANKALHVGTSPCSGNQSGWTRSTVEIMTDQNTPSQDIVASGQALSETVSVNPVGNGLGINGTYTGSQPTRADGTFVDTFFVCSPACTSGSKATSAATQAISDVYNGGTYRVNNALIYSCASILFNGNAQ